MRPWTSIVKAGAREASSDALSLLLALGAAATILLASFFHIHQFGEPARMARDASVSAILVFGFAYAAFGTVKAMRREAESGTLQMALSRPLSRTAYFFSRLAGMAVSYTGFAVVVSLAGFTMVLGAECGALAAAPRGDVPRVWGPALAAVSAVAVLPLAAAAALDRFFSFRFALSAARLQCVVAVLAALAAAALSVRAGFGTGPLESAAKFLPAALLAAMPGYVFAAAAAAFSVRLGDNAACASSALLFALSLPLLGAYCLSPALSKGGSIPAPYIALAAAAAVSAFAAFAFAGVALFSGKDVS